VVADRDPGAELRPGPWGTAIAVLHRIEDGLLVVLLTALLGLSAAQIVLRNLFDSGLLWADPALRVLVLWVGMAGALAATRDDRQITVDVIARYAPPRWKAAVRGITDTFTAVVCALLAYHGARLVGEDRAAGVTAFAAVPLWLCESVVPAAFAIIAVRSLLHAGRHLLALRRGGEAR
jgi:TRAP-type C4-dicarboxylate transport system permease small subunit